MRLPLVVTVMSHQLLAVGQLMLDGKWCSHCQDVKEEACEDGGCLAYDDETEIDFDAFQHEPVVDWGGGS